MSPNNERKEGQSGHAEGREFNSQNLPTTPQSLYNTRQQHQNCQEANSSNSVCSNNSSSGGLELVVVHVHSKQLQAQLVVLKCFTHDNNKGTQNLWCHQVLYIKVQVVSARPVVSNLSQKADKVDVTASWSGSGSLT